MDDSYLNGTTREFYSDALAHIRCCGDEFWDLDEGLDKFIDIVNSSPNVRTMFSKRKGNYSYLFVCYTKEVESQVLIDIDAKLKATFQDCRWCEYILQPQRPHTQNENEGHEYLRYIDDPNYYNINHVKFELKGGGSGHHDSFWTVLSEEL